MNVTGKCLCNKITVSFDRNKVLSTHHCHCIDCQKSTGAGKATILYLPKKHLTLSGQLKFYEVKGKLGLRVNRGFCDNCGSGVLSFTKEFKNLFLIKAGILDDSSWVKPQSNFFVSAASNWNRPEAELKHYQGNPGFFENLRAIIRSL